MIVAQFFVSPIVNLRFRLNLANNLFKFKISKEVKEHKKNKKKRINIKNLFKKKPPVQQQPSLTKTFDEKIMSYFMPNNSKKLQISYFSYYCSYCRNSITKIYNKLLNKGLNHIDQMLDISFIMSKLNEIDIMKVLLFDKTQRDLFEYLPKPQISLEENLDNKNIREEIKKYHDRNEDDKARIALRAYKTILDKRNRTVLDERLLEIVGKSNREQNKNKSLEREGSNVPKNNLFTHTFGQVKINKSSFSLNNLKK